MKNLRVGNQRRWWRLERDSRGSEGVIRLLQLPLRGLAILVLMVVLIHEHSGTEVGDFDAIVLRAEQVLKIRAERHGERGARAASTEPPAPNLRLEVAVHDSVHVEVSQSADNVAEVLPEDRNELRLSTAAVAARRKKKRKKEKGYGEGTTVRFAYRTGRTSSRLP
jgi:hypothetical protein